MPQSVNFIMSTIRAADSITKTLRKLRVVLSTPPGKLESA